MPYTSTFLSVTEGKSVRSWIINYEDTPDGLVTWEAKCPAGRVLSGLSITRTVAETAARREIEKTRR